MLIIKAKLTENCHNIYTNIYTNLSRCMLIPKVYFSFQDIHMFKVNNGVKIFLVYFLIIIFPVVKVEIVIDLSVRLQSLAAEHQILSQFSAITRHNMPPHSQRLTCIEDSSPSQDNNNYSVSGNKHTAQCHIQPLLWTLLLLFIHNVHIIIFKISMFSCFWIVSMFRV